MQSVIGGIYKGKVTGLTTFGAFVKMEIGESGMVHISEVAPVFVKEIKDFLTEGQDVTVKVLAVNENNKIRLSIKQAAENAAPAREERKRPPIQAPQERGGRRRQEKNAGGAQSVEDMMAQFKQDSEEKMSVLRRSADVPSRPRRK